METEVAVEEISVDAIKVEVEVVARKTTSLVSDAVPAKVRRTCFEPVRCVIVKHVGDRGMMRGVRRVRIIAD